MLEERIIVGAGGGQGAWVARHLEGFNKLRYTEILL